MHFYKTTVFCAFYLLKNISLLFLVFLYKCYIHIKYLYTQKFKFSQQRKISGQYHIILWEKWTKSSRDKKEVLWEATHLWINNLKCFTSKWDGYWSFLMSGELFKCRQTAIRMQNFEIQNKKITPPIAQQNWGFLGWKRQFSSDAGSSAIPGKLSSRNFVKQNLAVQLAVVFYVFVKNIKN